MLDKCYVSLCRLKTNNFWLISNQQHNRSKKLSLQNIRLSLNVLLKYWKIFGLEKTVQVISEALMVHEINESFNDLSIIDLDDYFNNELNKKREEENAIRRKSTIKKRIYKVLFKLLSEDKLSEELIETILSVFPLDEMPSELREAISNRDLK